MPRDHSFYSQIQWAVVSSLPKNNVVTLGPIYNQCTFFFFLWVYYKVSIKFVDPCIIFIMVPGYTIKKLINFIVEVIKSWHVYRVTLTCCRHTCMYNVIGVILLYTTVFIQNWMNNGFKKFKILYQIILIFWYLE